MYSDEIDTFDGQVYVVRQSDGAIVPADPANIDWQAYEAWLKKKGVPADPPRDAPRTEKKAL